MLYSSPPIRLIVGRILRAGECSYKSFRQSPYKPYSNRFSNKEYESDREERPDGVKVALVTRQNLRKLPSPAYSFANKIWLPEKFTRSRAYNAIIRNVGCR